MTDRWFLKPSRFFGFLVGILILRAWGRFYYFDFWAEDGTTFIAQAISHGFQSLSFPLGGSYATLQRLIAIATTQLTPMMMWPLALTVICGLITAYVFFLITRSDYEWLIPNPVHRVWAAILLTLTPGQNEMFGNLANLNWILFALLLLIGLKDIKKGVSTVDILISVLICVSIGTSVLLLPLFLFRALKADRRAWAISLIILLTNAVIYSLSHTLHPQDMANVVGMDKIPLKTVLSATPRFLYNTWEKAIVYRPWLGPGLATAINDYGKWLILMVLVNTIFWVSFAIWIKNHFRILAAQTIVLATVLVVSWGLLRGIGRPGSLELPFYFGNNYWALRHSFPVGFMATIFWMSFFSFIKNPLWKKRLFVAFIALGVIHGLDRFFIRAYEFGHEGYPTTRIWASNYKTLQQSLATGCPKNIRIPHYPHFEDWALSYQSQGCNSPPQP